MKRAHKLLRLQICKPCLARWLWKSQSFSVIQLTFLGALKYFLSKGMVCCLGEWHKSEDRISKS
jgi:hypothetical protein